MSKIDIRSIALRGKEAIKTGGKWAIEKTKNAIEYAKDNPQGAAAIVGLTMTITGGANKLLRTINRHQKLKQQQYHRDREIYDHSLNMFLTTKRKLTKKDIDKINEIMRKTGKRKSEVLSELNLLKR